MTAPQPHASEGADALQPSSAPGSMRFRSILFPGGTVLPQIDKEPQPECFTDLNLDQVVAAITTGREEYGLRPFFNIRSKDEREIHYRQEIFRDVERSQISGCLCTFAAQLRRLRDQLALIEKLYYELQKQACFLEAVKTYHEAVRELADGLTKADIHSEGLRAFCLYLNAFTETPRFQKAEADARRIAHDIEEIRYALLIEGRQITVRPYEPEPDYGADVLETFERFSQGAAKEYRFSLPFSLEMNPVEAAILERVARLYPDVFSALADFCSSQTHFQDAVIARFDREAQFYLAWIEHMARFRKEGLSFCYPSVSARSKTVSAHGAFDLALAQNLRTKSGMTRIVPNDFSLSCQERILVVTGPNQGGKTTFARMFGQLHYLAGLGCPVPAREARLFLADRIFTHFEKEENVGNLTGKLEDELRRIREILDSATPDSLLIMNESFLSTTVKDALFLSRKIMARIVELDMICVSVTFLDDLIAMSASAVSMVGEIDPQDASRRTFKVVRKPANGLAYAMAIAEKYRLTERSIINRIEVHARRQTQ